jgi:hypothetical protein
MSIAGRPSRGGMPFWVMGDWVIDLWRITQGRGNSKSDPSGLPGALRGAPVARREWQEGRNRQPPETQLLHGLFVGARGASGLSSMDIAGQKGYPAEQWEGIAVPAGVSVPRSRHRLDRSQAVWALPDGELASALGTHGSAGDLKTGHSSPSLAGMNVHPADAAKPTITQRNRRSCGADVPPHDQTRRA